MNLEQQVCSLDLAKKLKELGVKQESLFRYSIVDVVPHGKEYRLFFSDNAPCYHELDYSAFTASELGEMLPLINGCSLQILKGYIFGFNKPQYCCRYDSLDIDNTIFLDFNMANSCAKMLIYLLENKLISVL